MIFCYIGFGRLYCWKQTNNKAKNNKITAQCSKQTKQPTVKHEYTCTLSGISVPSSIPCSTVRWADEDVCAFQPLHSWIPAEMQIHAAKDGSHASREVYSWLWRFPESFTSTGAVPGVQRDGGSGSLNMIWLEMSGNWNPPELNW